MHHTPFLGNVVIHIHKPLDRYGEIFRRLYTTLIFYFASILSTTGTGLNSAHRHYVVSITLLHYYTRHSSYVSPQKWRSWQTIKPMKRPQSYHHHTRQYQTMYFLSVQRVGHIVSVCVQKMMHSRGELQIARCWVDNYLYHNRDAHLLFTLMLNIYFFFIIYLIEAGWRIFASLNSIIIGSYNGLSPFRWQAITWTNGDLLLIGTNFDDFFIGIKTFSLTKLHLKMSSAKLATILSRPQCVNIALYSYNAAWAHLLAVTTHQLLGDWCWVR